MNDIVIKYSDENIINELNLVGFDKSYIQTAEKKYKGFSYKIFNLKPYEANILKQLCLSLGFDCAVNRETIMCKCDYTNAILYASDYQILKLIDKLKNQPFKLKELALKFESIINNKKQELKIRNCLFDWSKPYIMGILNVTPDSFSDGGKYLNMDNAVNHAVKMIDDGADIIDIGGESTRPEALQVNINQEMDRIIPVIQKIRDLNINIPISVDTRNYETAKAAIHSGADIINDVSGFDYDKNLFDYVTKNNIPSIVMHSNNVPALNKDFSSGCIIDEIYVSLYNKINGMINAGISKHNIIADTGIGFGKSMDTCFEILKRHNEFSSLGVPLLLGISRKSFLRNKLNLSISDSDTASVLYSLLTKGVNIHRVHNVKLFKSYIDMLLPLFKH